MSCHEIDGQRTLDLTKMSVVASVDGCKFSYRVQKRTRIGLELVNRHLNRNDVNLIISTTYICQMTVPLLLQAQGSHPHC